MIEFAINAKSVAESNWFLRKLWCELSKIRQIAWQYQPIRQGNKIIIGISNFGEIAFDYKVSGCIRNLYIDNSNEAETDQILAAIRCAIDGEMTPYAVKLFLAPEKTRLIANTSGHDISISTSLGRNELTTNILAYSAADVREQIRLKIWTIQALLYVYTSHVFSLKKILCTQIPAVIVDAEPMEYDISWIDYSDIPKVDGGEIIVPKECLALLSLLLKDNVHEKNLELLFNSARMLLASRQIEKGLSFPNMPGVADIIDSAMISSIEPLAYFLDKRARRCTECGNLSYSIVAKIKQLLEKYISRDFAEYYCKEFYTMRSSLFHEGHMLANFTTGSYSYPLIDPLRPREMLMARSVVLVNLAEYSAFVFRQIVHEYYNTGIDVIEADGTVVNIRYPS